MNNMSLKDAKDHAFKADELNLDELEQVAGGRYRYVKAGSAEDDPDRLSQRVSCPNCHDTFMADPVAIKKGLVRCRTCHQLITSAQA